MAEADREAMRAELARLGATERQLALLERVPPGVVSAVLRQMRSWPGRLVMRTVSGLQRIQVFDRSMTIAAQLFTSVFPVIIMGAALFGSDQVSWAVSSGNGLPPDTQELLDQVSDGSDTATFGLLGVLVVLISATSLSRALTRAYDAVWMHGRTRTKITQAWRWLVAVVGLALALVVTQKLSLILEGIPPRHWWPAVLIIVLNIGIATLVPWLLMAGRVPITWLLPGAMLFALGMLLTHPVATRYLSISIEVSADRFGAIGVAFTYLTYLYAVSWWLLATAVIGQVVVAHEGAIGHTVRGWSRPDRPAPAVSLPQDDVADR